MKKEELTDVLSRIDERFIEEAAMYVPANTSSVKMKREPGLLKVSLLAACFAIIVVLGISIPSFVAEARAYNTAVAFFEENHLSMEGLSRADIKAVYRDFSTPGFSSEKTADILWQSVQGHEILQEPSDPDELFDLMSRGGLKKCYSMEGYSYRIFYGSESDENYHDEDFYRSTLKCFKSGQQIFERGFKYFFITDCIKTSMGTAVWGYNENTLKYYVSVLDETGKNLWAQELNHSKDESIAAVLDDGEDSLVVFSQYHSQELGPTYKEYLCITYYDKSGRETESYVTEIGNRAKGSIGVFHAVKIGEDFLIQAGSKYKEEMASVIRVNHEGEIIDSFSYEGADCEYYIIDMMNYKGQIYLSAYAIPVQTGEGPGREISNINQYIWSKMMASEGSYAVTEEEITSLMKDNYTAVLLICDPDVKIINTFYSVKASFGSQLSTNDSGELCWNVQTILSAGYSPATNSFTIYGKSKLYQYDFDSSGKLLRQTDTGEKEPYFK